jgi:hypothetical protein
MSGSCGRVYDLTDKEYDILEKDDIELIESGFSLMKQVFFGKMSIKKRAPGKNAGKFSSIADRQIAEHQRTQ